MASTDDAHDARYYGIHEGTVTDNRDPQLLGRCRICVPGLLPDEGGTWAFQCGMLGAGSAQRGQWDIPEKGAEVYVWFLGGDPEKIRFTTGHHGRGELPSAVQAAIDAADTQEAKVDAMLQVKVLFETSDWEIVVDERPGNRRLYIRSKSLGEDLNAGSALMIELDREQGILGLSGIRGLFGRSVGLVDFLASVVQVGGRKVVQGVEDPL